jgi:short-chain fatty acids transporter
MLERVSSALTRWCVRYIPDGYVIAGVLTILVVLLAFAFTSRGAVDLAFDFGEGFWGFIPFTLQMSMVVLTGYIVAEAPPVRRTLHALAGWPQTPSAAIALTALVSMSLAFVNWGLSIVASAILARRIGERRMGVDYRLLVACAYLGLGCLWHSGLSASAPLTSSDPNQGFVKQYLKEPIPVTDTVFSSFNIGLALLVLVAMTLVAVIAHPKNAAPFEIVPEPEDSVEDRAAETPAQRLEKSPLVNLALGGLIFAYLPIFLSRNGIARININHVNLLFFGLGAILHLRPSSFLHAAERGGRHVWGVLVQFCIYAGVAGVLDKSGLASALASFFVRISSPETFPALVVWYSGVLNYLVPSGGAKWFIEVQYLADAARGLGVPLSKTIVAYAWGDMLTDIIQPFWAIPLLAMARLGFRDIMGYCIVLFAAYASIVTAAFLAWGFA